MTNILEFPMKKKQKMKK